MINPRAYIDNFLKYLSDDRGAAANTVEAYRRDITLFTDYLNEGWIGLDKLTDIVILSFLSKMLNAGASTATTRRALSSVKTFCRYLSNHGVIRTDPSYGVKLPSPPTRRAGADVSVDVTALLGATDLSSPTGVRDRAIIAFMAFTGIRVGELIGLRADDTHVGLNFVECRSRRKTRVIPINAAVAETVGGYIKSARSAFIKEEEREELFLSRRGQPFTRQGVWKLIHGYVEKAGMDGVTPASLREAFAKRAAAAGTDIRALSEMMGVAGIGQTRKYYAKEPKLLEEYLKSNK